MPSEQSLTPMSDSTLTSDPHYQSLVSRISDIYTTGQLLAHQAVNTHLTQTYWQIGHDIVEFEQGGQARAEYGKAMLESLSRDLTLRHGKGFSRSNVSRFRQFYLLYPICASLPHKLSWTISWTASSSSKNTSSTCPTAKNSAANWSAPCYMPKPSKNRRTRMNRILRNRPRIVGELHALFSESAKLEQAIKASLREVGYGG